MVLAPTQITVRVAEPARHVFEIETRVGGLDAGFHDFVMPVWTPGSYLVREHSRHVLEASARDGSGRPLRVEKTAKNRWRVALPEPGDLLFVHRLYARDLTVRTNHCDESRAFWLGAAAYVYEESRRDGPYEIRFDGPDAWQVLAPLPVRDGAFAATDFDEAADTPFAAGSFGVERFSVHGIEHEVAVDGRPPARFPELVQALPDLVRANAEVFGGRLPYERYLFLFAFDEHGSGGLEHAAGTFLHVGRRRCRSDEGFRKLLTLCAHEHFHAWNAKRIRPVGLECYDYERENYTRGLWLAEGVTSYYENLTPHRAGLLSRADLLARLARTAGSVLETPGRFRQSLAEASFDAWIKLYRPDENSRNATISYYTKGALAAFCLDALIQAGSEGARCLDDVMRVLYADAEARGPGQPAELVRRAAEEAAGRDLGSEFDLLFESREDPPLDEWLAAVGLRLLPPEGPERAHLGIATRRENGRLFVASVDDGGPGREMGLCPGDEIVGVDGERVLPQDFKAAIAEERRPGAEVTLNVFRRGLLTECRGRLGAKRSGEWKLIELEGGLSYRG